MIGEKLLDKAFQLDEELDYDFVERLVKPYKKESSLIIIDDGIQKISKSLTKLFLEGKILQISRKKGGHTECFLLQEAIICKPVSSFPVKTCL